MFLSLIIFNSCDEDESILKKPSESSILILNQEDVPDITGFNVIYDNTRETTLNKETGILQVPVNYSKNTMRKDELESPDVKWRVATRKSGCKDGVGFRCGNNLPKIESKGENKDNKRTLQASIIKDNENGYINFQFDKNTDWGNF